MNKPDLKPKAILSGSDAAPIIFFDGVVVWGVGAGIVQLELAANELVPTDLEGGPVRTKVVAVAHLRCPIPAAQQLRGMIDAALNSLAPPDGKPN